MTRDEALALVGPCVAVPSWAESVVDARPHADVAAALAAGDAAAARWTGPTSRRRWPTTRGSASGTAGRGRARR